MRAPTDILRVHFSHLCSPSCAVEPIGGAEINSANYLVRPDASGNPAYLLKCECLGGAASLERRMNSVAIHRYAADREALLPKLLPAGSGEAAVVDGLLVYRLMEYREGGCFPGTPEALASAGRALAGLHVALRGADFPEIGDPLYGALSADERETASERIVSGEVEGDFADRVLAWLQSEAEPLYREQEALEAGTDSTRQWVHGDFHPGNVLFDGAGVSAILDPDSMVKDFRMQAIAFAASRFAGLEDGERIRIFLRAYHEADALGPAEVRAFPAFVRREALRRLSWIVRENVLGDGDAWRDDFEKHRETIAASRACDVVFDLPDEAVAAFLAGSSVKP